MAIFSREIRGLLETIPVCLALAALVGCASKPEAMAPGPPPDDAVPLQADLKDFVLGPGDELEITVWRYPDLSRVARVSSGGEIQIPLVGDMRVTGISAFQVRDELRARLAEYIIDPQVNVSIRTLRSQKVFVVGEVRRGGVFPLEPDLTVLDAITKAGDFNNDAKKSEVLLVRKAEGSKTVIYPLNFEKMFKEGDLRQNPRVAPGDVVFVPPLLLADLSRDALRITAILSPLIAAESAFSTFEDIVIKWPATQRAFSGQTVLSQPTTQTIIIQTPPAP